MNKMIAAPSKCPACYNQNIVYLRNVKGQRTDKELKLYSCNNCHSLFNPSGYVEEENALKADLQWHIDWFDYNAKKAPLLLNKLTSLLPQAETFLDIGCGIGATVLQAKSLGMKAEGVEPNCFAVEYGKKKFDLDLKCDYFRENLFTDKFDLIVCEQVLEHLEDPRQLFKTAIATLNRPGILFISVPFRKDVIRQLIYNAFPNLPGTIFYDNDVHITHLSHRVMKLWAKEFEVDAYKRIKCYGTGYAFQFK